MLLTFVIEFSIRRVTLASTSALQANNNQDRLVKPVSNLPLFYIKNTLEGKKVPSKILHWNIEYVLDKLCQWVIVILFLPENFIFQRIELRTLTGPSSCSLRLGNHN